MAVFGTLMSEQKRIASGLCGFWAITRLIDQVVGWLSGTASIIPSSLSRCSSFAAFWPEVVGDPSLFMSDWVDIFVYDTLCFNGLVFAQT